ncbi:MAG: SUF system NifU family Fe-S cluster assembly protein [Chloroflexi bacterium]|jgi:nitrogen fixation NifU-like protein|uniref:SUF system NifU family Fe-S cluster assembly protein n=1 Tax=Candidatus Thermofonsia Clade 3 bacterium TaxID=2364212 RepID=A0A2M8QG71_9CHLR|nr:SUF system NifU family Fe-S cluster assembly protein [Candidatus Roseilinea sp. NK_OTU-006]PJF48789.1 MAG: SUF system NifU family Fe-S cluster assembly protein [Candidatus Thermofonsia Clade 3 bacterium]RMG63620.1 MAG: SUF system NifU family Fe-S cluster assembly protein [Chloroflexota bacterium]
MQDLYREHILDHYENPRHHGVIEHADISHEESNPLCGDRIRIDVKLGSAGDRVYIADAAFTGDGCIISQAATSMLLEDVVGKPVDEIDQIEPQRVLDLVGVPLTAARVKCALLGLKVLKTGIKLWTLRHP